MTLIEPGHWTIDRRIALPTIFALFFQSVALVAIGSWYASEYNGRINVMETTVRAHSMRIATVEMATQNSLTTVARIDERWKATNETLRDMKIILEGLARDAHRNTFRSGQ